MRRRAVLAAIGFAACGRAMAQEAWPVRQARIIIPFAAGGPQNIPARIIADRLSQRLGATFVVENRPGAGGGLGAQTVARAAPDGATLLFISASISILPTLQPALNFDPARDLDPLTVVCDLPAGILVRGGFALRHAGGAARRRAVRRDGRHRVDARALSRRQPGGERALRR